MGSTEKGPTKNGAPAQPSLFESAERKTRVQRNEAELQLSAQPNIPLRTEPATGNQSLPPVDSATEIYREPIWAQRLKLVVFVLFCVELGMLLFVLPWTPVWTNNSLLAGHAQLRAFLHSYFTRGAITGIGLVDIWIGIWSAVQYREHKSGR